jgi:pimeloyl-ACP methyl ester carboxylesterase
MKSTNRKWSVTLFGVAGLFSLIYLVGPKSKTPDFSTITIPDITSNLHALEDSITAKEALIKLKPDNEARIVWATPYKKTPYAMVYLHGLAGSPEEGDPLHEALAHRYGCNLYLARLEGHGLVTDDPLQNIDPAKWMQSALDAIAIGKTLGEKVIVVSCSTGSTFSLYLAAHYPELVDGQILFSPNIDYYDPRSFLMARPWGLQITRFILGSNFYGWKASGTAQQYWYTRYRIEGIITLKSILNETMTAETFSQIESPLFLSYYFRDEINQDKIVSVERMKEMFSGLGTPSDLKREVPLKNAGTHIITSDLFSNDLAEVWIPLTNFCEQVLQLTPVNDSDWKMFLDIR